MLLLESAALYTALLFCIFLVVVYLYLTRNFNYWKRKGIPYAEPLPFFGNLKEVFLQKAAIGIHLKDIYSHYKDDPYVGIFAMDKPALLVRDLEIIKEILLKHSHHFADHNVGIDEGVDPLWGKMIFSLKGQQWKHIRNKLSPTFSTGKMKVMFELVNNCAKELVQVLDGMSADGSPVPLKETLARFTTDAIGTCALGIESNAMRDPDSEVRRQMKTVFNFSVKKGVRAMLMFFTPDLSRFLKIKFVEEDTEKFFRDTVWRTIKYREENGVVRKDLVDSMMELRKQDVEGVDEKTNIKIDGDMLVAQIFNIFLGGFETSASTSTFALFELAYHPEIQSRARSEILQVLKEHNELTYDAIHEMKYLDMVVSETMRKYPVLPFLDRVCNKAFEIQDPSGKHNVAIQKGVSIFIPIFGIHKNPEYFPEPEKFDPDRFTEENKKNRHNFCYMPFGEGPRHCIGKRFGLMQVKTALSYILSNFEVAPCKDTPLRPTFDPKSFIMQHVDEIPLTFKRLQITA